jgi:hypothetical protein
VKTRSKRKYTLTPDGLWGLRLHAEYSKCMYCGRFINFQTEEHGWYDPTGPWDFERKDPIPFHKTCREKSLKLPRRGSR